MDIKIPDSWLSEFLKTTASPQKVGELISLCGPSIERIEKAGKDYIYSIEVTTNRVDTAGVYGIAREASAILPKFGIKAELLPIKVESSQPLSGVVEYIEAEVDPKLCPRFTAILIKNIKVGQSPKLIQDRLEKVGVRPLNNIIDISNYLMHEFGQPTHTFDYDKIKGHKMILRPSKPGEKVTTLDNKEYVLPGGDIIIEDGEGRIIDLAGIMGGKLSSVDENTKNVLFFVQTYNPVQIRKTSMALAKRSEAASLFEKGLDTEQVEVVIRRGVDMFVNICKGEPVSQILDLYPNPYKGKQIKASVEFINNRLGVKITQKEIEDILKSLGFSLSPRGSELTIDVPSFRSRDISIPEDIIEEVARIYGYHKLPGILMTGSLPEPLRDSPFEFEAQLRSILKGWGGIEVYTLSLVPKDKITISGSSSWALKLRNPLGTESEYLRQSLAPSLNNAVAQNAGEKEPYHLFEMSNVYLPIRGKLPEERMMLAGVFTNYDYRKAKGIVEALLAELRSLVSLLPEDAREFVPNTSLTLKQKSKHKKETIGQFGILRSSNLIYYEFDVELLRAASNLSFAYTRSSSAYTKSSFAYTPLPKYPPQIEDIALIVPAKTYVGEVIESISKEKQVSSVELIDVYNNTKTFRVAYQSPTKTLTDKEVERIRSKILQNLKNKFGVVLKS